MRGILLLQPGPSCSPCFAMAPHPLARSDTLSFNGCLHLPFTCFSFKQIGQSHCCGFSGALESWGPFMSAGAERSPCRCGWL